MAIHVDDEKFMLFGFNHKINDSLKIRSSNDMN